MMMLDYKLLDALAKIVELQGFDLAAKHLYITQSAISQRIKSLEENIGQPVLIRSQPIKVTAAGEKLLSHYAMVQQLENEMLPSLLPNAPVEPLKVSLAINADSLATWFISALSPILSKYLVELNLIVERESVTLDKLKNGSAIGAVSSIAKPLAGYRAFELGDINYILVASKSFQTRYFAEGLTTETLKMAPGISYDHKDDMHTRFISQHFNLAASEYYCHTVRSSEAFVELAKQGVAYCLVPQLQIKNELASGELINLCPDKQLIETLYWHSWVLVKGINKKISEEIVRYGQKLLS
ncbi:MAG: LysR family transcriptional regulator ArgP [Alteromonadaceae bacterium]|nr:LysR family transcriptional regulator ArgP [Alteromonadaceae bacterium]